MTRIATLARDYDEERHIKRAKRRGKMRELYGNEKFKVIAEIASAMWHDDVDKIC